MHGGIDIVVGALAGPLFLRFNEVPEIDIALISTDNTPGALGEIGTMAVAGAVGNALSRASGVGQYKYPSRGWISSQVRTPWSARRAFI